MSKPEIQTTPPTLLPWTLTEWWRWARDDIQAVLANDPAARNLTEVLAAYPGLHALWIHRVSHHLWHHERPTTARILSHLGRALTGIEIHPGATLGRGVFIDHGMGVVIGETAIVGDDCLIYKGVVLGGTTLERSKRHPTLGKGVVVGSNACILGNLKVGDGARIGSGSVVVKDVPAGATAVGVPGKIVATPDPLGPLDHGQLPDPIAALLRSLLDEIDKLQKRVDTLEHKAPSTP